MPAVAMVVVSVAMAVVSVATVKAKADGCQGCTLVVYLVVQVRSMHQRST